MLSTPEQPDTPPPTRSQPSFISQSSTASMQSQHTQPATPQQANQISYPHGMETPPTSAMHFNHHTALLTPGPTGTPPRNQGQLGESIPPPHCGRFERKTAAEAWATAGWGGKKALEEYEIQRDRLLDSGLNLGIILPVPNKGFVSAKLQLQQFSGMTMMKAICGNNSAYKTPSH